MHRGYCAGTNGANSGDCFVPAPIFPASLLLVAGGGRRGGTLTPSNGNGGTNTATVATAAATEGNVNTFDGTEIPSSIAKLFSHVQFPKVNCSTQVDIVGPWSAAGGGSLDMIGGPILRIEASAAAASGGISGRPSRAQLKDEARRGMALLSTAATLERLGAPAAAAAVAEGSSARADGFIAVHPSPSSAINALVSSGGFPSLPHTTQIHRFTAAIAFSPVFTASLRLMFRVIVKTDDDELLLGRRDGQLVGGGNTCSCGTPLPSAAEAQRFISHLTERIVSALTLEGQRMADCLKVLYDNGIPFLTAADADDE